jgi:hypothetical protein
VARLSTFDTIRQAIEGVIAALVETADVLPRV